MCITVYSPSDEESARLLANVTNWVEKLRKQNVSSDIAAYIARDFLSPMRIKPLDGDSCQRHECQLPGDFTQAVSSYVPVPAEVE